MKPSRGPRAALTTAAATVLLGLTGVTTPADAAPAAGGDVLSWGDNTHLQLGAGPSENQRATAEPVCRGREACFPLGSVVDVEAGGTHSVALLSNGTAVSWGNAENGRLGDGRRTNPPASGLRDPQRVCAVGSATERCQPLTGVQDISTSRDHTLAVVQEANDPTSRSVVAWGVGEHGRLGATGNKEAVVPVYACRAEASSVCAGGVDRVSAGGEHSLALLRSGGVVSWGDNAAGQLGRGGGSEPASVPVCPGDQHCAVVAVAAGTYHSAAVTADGRVFTWGRNDRGQLGHHLGSLADQRTPAAVEGLVGKPVAVAAGEAHTVVLMADGTVMAWGDASAGQLGDGTTMSYNTMAKRPPVWVCGPHRPSQCATNAQDRLSDIVRIDANADHTVAVDADGTVFAWGSNGHYQLGNTSVVSSAYPVIPRAPNKEPLTGVTRISAGAGHMLALHDPAAYAVPEPLTDHDNGGKGWQLRLVHSGFCAGASEKGGSDPLRQQSCTDPGRRQRFVLAPRDGGYEFRLLNDRTQCLDVETGAQGDVPLILYSCHGGENQLFRIDPARGPGPYQLKAAHSGRCLGVKGASDEKGARIVQMSCAEDGSRWAFI